MSDETLKAFQQAKAQLERKKRRAKPKPNGPVAHQPTGDWHDLLLRTSKGEVRDCVANVCIALRADPAFSSRLTYNLMRCRTVVGPAPWHACKKPRDWTERDDIALAEWLQLQGVPVKPVTCAQAVRNVAAEHAVHPLCERLESLVWDGTPRLDHWLVDCLDVEDSAYVRAVGRKWLISAVARAFQPGCKADHALILEGAQRALKSTVAEVLALEREWFTDEIAERQRRNPAQDLPGKWIIEIAELASMRRGLVERIKAFLSRRIDHYRPSYGRYSEDFPRGCVFLGSTNEGQYLQDATGNRRFWPVRVGKVELDLLRQCIEQLWAEAVAAFKAGETWWLDEAHEELAAVEQEQRRQVDPWEELVLNAAEKVVGRVTTNAIFEALSVPKERRDRSSSIRVGFILTEAKWLKCEDRNANPRYWYERPTLC